VDFRFSSSAKSEIRNPKFEIAMPIHLVIHGHFYQPPRENPWTGVIERQESAAPFHDWNARIASEGYEPNARSRVLDAHGRILDIVNNYERISFNVGPTLLSWLEGSAPEVLRALLAADGASLSRLGHGNAIAQAYNHMILPLASLRDRWTQIGWGIREFRHRFGRPPEAMWLPEAAVDAATLGLLIRAGMRYVILSPAQAARFRPPGQTRWITTAEAELDPRRPYRWRLPDGTGGSQEELGIAICFYHGPLSRGVSFQHYLRDASLFADRIAEAAAGMPDPLILIATDGESFGHHEPFGDMCLATLFAREAGRREFHITNLAAYLESHPPTWEVELLPESAWSCSHGVGRWREDCGCSAGGGAGWNQRWRRPLRQGLDRLRDALGEIFREEAAPLLRDVWAARDDYIELLLDPREEAREAFFARHQARSLAGPERATALRLLEMQHQAMLMYTSCGWFFSDISGIETVQNLRYAARALELAESFAPLDLEAVLLEDLARARSNVPAHQDGRRIWERQVRSSRVAVEAAVARLLLEGVMGREVGPQVRYRWRLTPGPMVQEGGLVMAGIQAASEVTGEVLGFLGVCRREGRFDFLSAIVPWSEERAQEREFSEAFRDIRASLDRDGSGLEAWGWRHGARLIGLRHFLPDERRAILEELLADVEASVIRSRDVMIEEAVPAAQALAAAGMALPEWMRAVLEASRSRQLAEMLEKLNGVADPARYSAALDLVDQARSLGLTLDLKPASAWFGRMLIQRLDAIAAGSEAEAWQSFLELLKTGARLTLSLPERALQDRMLAVTRDRVPELLGRVRDGRDPIYPLLSAILAVATRLNLNTDEARERLRPLEARLAEDPALWP
jgi:alpha-amylase/alpha-mannosidase (GH57 family)